MTRIQSMEQRLANLESQMAEIETNFGRAAAPVELEQQISEIRSQLAAMKAEENRKEQFLDFCEKICLAAGLQKITDGEFRKKELYDEEVAVKYNDEPDDEFRVIITTVCDYSKCEVAIRYKRTHSEQKVVETKQRVLYKVGYNHFAFNNDAYDQMLKFIRVNADESVSFLREAEYRWSVQSIRSVFAQQGITEEAWTPAESEFGL